MIDIESPWKSENAIYWDNMTVSEWIEANSWNLKAADGYRVLVRAFIFVEAC
jgi:hypothetical protein